MLEWLTRRKKRRELPEYSRLRAVPTRDLPSDLVQMEAGEVFAARYDVIARDLRTSPDQPRDGAPLFTSLVLEQGRAAVTFPLPDDGGHCLPVFSTPFRAADYAQTLLTSMSSVQYLASTASQLLGMVHDLETVGISALAVDRCPRCPIFSSVKTASLKAARDLLELWAIHKTTELSRMQLYFDYALRSARAGHLETAREVALETVGHVSLENPRLHLLLGQIAVGLSDRTLLREAKAFLVYFKHESCDRSLDQTIQAGQPTFEGLD